MKTTDAAFKDLLKQLPDFLQDSIESALDFLVPDTNAVDDEFLKMLKELSPETYETVKQGMSLLKNGPKQEIKVKILSTQNVEFNISSEHEEEIIIWKGSFETSENVSFDSKVFIIDGDLICNHIIVNDSYLFVNGKIICNILYGASGNDKMTHITSTVKAKAMVENGHYTLVEEEIYADAIVQIHNEIKSNKEIKSDIIFDVHNENKLRLNTKFVDADGYFDEDKFLKIINSTRNVRLFE